MWTSLKSERMSSDTGFESDVPENSSLPSASSETFAMRAMRSASAISHFVQVGDLNMTVSDSISAAMSPAIAGEGITPCS